MKVLRTFAILSALFLAVTSCKVEKPADTDGHDLWFHNLEKVADAAPAEYTTEAIAQSEIDQYWKGKAAVEIKVLDQKDEALGRDGYRLVFSKGKVAVEANTAIGNLLCSLQTHQRKKTGAIVSSLLASSDVSSIVSSLSTHQRKKTGAIVSSLQASSNSFSILSSLTASQQNKKDEGKEFDVLVEGFSKRSREQLCGRTEQNKMVVFPKAGHHIGEIVRVKITGSTSATLLGECV